MRPLAVCLLFRKQFHNKMLILAVSRKDNWDDYGLPGGKVDEGETMEEAIARECLEETGYMPKGLREIFFSQNHGYDVMTYTCNSLVAVGVAEEEGVVAWLEEKALISKKSSYSEYNRKLLQYLEAL